MSSQRARIRNQKMNPRKNSVLTRRVGYQMRYAPITAAMAPDAPMTGVGLDGSTSIWARVATTPPTR